MSDFGEVRSDHALTCTSTGILAGFRSLGLFRDLQCCPRYFRGFSLPDAPSPRKIKKGPQTQVRGPFPGKAAGGGRRVGLYAGKSRHSAMTCVNTQGGCFGGYLGGYVRRRPRPGVVRTEASPSSELRRSGRCARKYPSPSPVARREGRPSRRRIRVSGPRSA